MPNLNDFAENGVLRAALSHGVRPLGGTQIMPVACERGCSAQAGVLEGQLRPGCSVPTDCGKTRTLAGLSCASYLYDPRPVQCCLHELSQKGTSAPELCSAASNLPA